jgi:hypothetical protein
MEAWKRVKKKRDNGVFVAKSHGIFLQIKFKKFVMELFHIKKAWKYFCWEF